MSSQLHPDLEQSLSDQFAAVADDDRVTRTAAALEANGISVLRAGNAGEAKRIVLGLIPAGSEVYQGASQTLDVSGITEEIERPSGRYEPLRPRMLSMDRETEAGDIRRLNAADAENAGADHHAQAEYNQVATTEQTRQTVPRVLDSSERRLDRQAPAYGLSVR